ncbi:uncharacterized protein LOC120358599 isoform X3 [Solenopsis invicta]|uniref:uncharacterized protein LOC120358599 isoform X3 n=1 Tax=Solenopsis invicta TaxID=13686 RepID=UPI00193CB979|nr:uncharacterized protein LOC120358599 isoform X3 [Solenopsis invicta]
MSKIRRLSAQIWGITTIRRLSILWITDMLSRQRNRPNTEGGIMITQPKLHMIKVFRAYEVYQQNGVCKMSCPS